MTIISNAFAPNCRHLLSKYTISTLQSVDIADNQHGYGCITKFSRFTRELLRSYVILYCVSVGSPTAFTPKFATKLQNFGELTGVHTPFYLIPYCRSL